MHTEDFKAIEQLQALALRQTALRPQVEIDAQGAACWFSRDTKHAQVFFPSTDKIRLQLWDRARPQAPSSFDLRRTDGSAHEALQRVQDFFDS